MNTALDKQQFISMRSEVHFLWEKHATIVGKTEAMATGHNLLRAQRKANKNWFRFRTPCCLQGRAHASHGSRTQYQGSNICESNHCHRQRESGVWFGKRVRGWVCIAATAAWTQMPQKLSVQNTKPQMLVTAHIVLSCPQFACKWTDLSWKPCTKHQVRTRQNCNERVFDVSVLSASTRFFVLSATLPDLVYRCEIHQSLKSQEELFLRRPNKYGSLESAHPSENWSLWR